jgi:hypothetical protein
MEISPGLEEQDALGEEKAASLGLKCSTCGIYPNQTNRGGRYVGENFFCMRHATLIKGASARLASLWGTLQGSGSCSGEFSIG